MPIGPITPGIPTVITPDPAPVAYASVNSPSPTMDVDASHIAALTLVALNIQQNLKDDLDGSNAGALTPRDVTLFGLIDTLGTILLRNSGGDIGMLSYRPRIYLADSAGLTYGIADADTFYVPVGSLSAPRSYTITGVGAVGSPRLRFVWLEGTHNVTLKQDDGSTIAVLGLGAWQWYEIENDGLHGPASWYFIGGKLT